MGPSIDSNTPSFDWRSAGTSLAPAGSRISGGLVIRPSGRAREVWWRWGRVELPVQNPSPGTSYERVR